MRTSRLGTSASAMTVCVVLGGAMCLCTCLGACSSDVDSGAEPWRGSLANGLDHMESLASEGAFDDALAVADRMQAPDAFAQARTWLERVTGGVSETAMRPIGRALDAFGFDALKDADRAEIEFARAVTLLGSLAGSGPGAGAAPGAGDGEDAEGRLQRAVGALDRARVAGGPARLDAVYDLGGLDLAAAEMIRETIPEISGGPPPPPAAGSAMAAEKDDEDPLDVARRGYLAAREHLIERLLLGSDADTRANAELVTRRLRELDEIERQREEQQQEQDEQSQDQSDSESKDKEGDPKEQDPDDESQPKDGDDESEDDPKEEPEKPEDESPEDESETEDDESEADDESDPQEPEPAKPEERLMTEEERQRVMERNREYQEAGEALKRILRMRRKIPAKRDW